MLNERRMTPSQLKRTGLYWLIKSEPHTWSWADQVRENISQWDGVRNYQAANYLRQMRLHDCALFYHSVTEKAIQGIVEVAKEAYPDSTDPTGKFVMVDFKTVKPFSTPVSLATIKAHPLLQDLPLLRQSRLSVMPISPQSWDILCQLGG